MIILAACHIVITSASSLCVLFKCNMCENNRPVSLQEDTAVYLNHTVGKYIITDYSEHVLANLTNNTKLGSK